MNINTVHLVGRLGQNPEIRFTSNGLPVCNMSLATSEKWKKDGADHERTDWHNIRVFGKTAEACGQHLEKGQLVGIEGQIRTDTYDKDGERKWFTYIAARRVHFGPKAKGNGRGGGDYSNDPMASGGDLPPPAPDDDDIPF